MKYPAILTLCASATLLAGCAAAPTTPSRPADTSYEQGDPKEKPPRVGMTKAQVLAQCGEPKSRSVTEQGEIWVYLLNFGEMIGKALIPFHPITTPRTGSVTFGPDGKVKAFNWQAHTEG